MTSYQTPDLRAVTPRDYGLPCTKQQLAPNAVACKKPSGMYLSIRPDGSDGENDQPLDQETFLTTADPNLFIADRSSYPEGRVYYVSIVTTL